ncbi:hypothetical protein BRADI_3g55297v3 [Brachypodium distachyon]|uniref:At1g61320/AtMIF1 LRR domain-containing protein n=1 Tax=Brachypodium distachyon TaxID=15368 RepID=A0A2K2D581_BRADI|nr:hypothetical protein BRADI_3g55297v3 [Brachypodium distachyon]
MADAVVLNIMSSCCALHSLTLRDCDQLTHILEFDFCDSLLSVGIHADKLLRFVYKGHKINIGYEYAPILHQLYVYFVKKNECPLDFISALPKLPKLEMLVLQFPERLQVSRALQHTVRFAGLTAIVLSLLKSWKESICSLAYLLKAAPLVEYFGLHGCSELQQPIELNITWPEDFTLARLYTIIIRGFSGESELMELLYFLLRRTTVLEMLQMETRAKEPRHVKLLRHQSEDATRCPYAREMALTHLGPKVPPTVKFSVT